MDRTDRTAIGIAAAGHVLLFGMLSLGWLAVQPPVPAPPQPISVSILDTVGLEATAPQSVTPPAQSRALEQGPPADAPAPASPQPAPEPAPAPPAPQPKPAPAPRPAPAPPQPKPQPAPVAPAPKQDRTPPKRTAAPAAKAPARTAGNGTAGDIRKRAAGSQLGDIMKGVGAAPSKSTSQAPQAATMSTQAQMDIGSKILQQVQPCANRQVKPGPGAERIRVTVRLRLRRDGSLASDPQVVGSDGVDDDNGRYLDRVKDNAIATFKGCAPLRDLPANLYDVPRGWSVFTMRYRLPG